MDEADGDAIVRCDFCSSPVRLRVTQVVTRVYAKKPVEERWCTKCVSDVDDNTKYVEGMTSGVQDTSEIGL